MYFNPPSIVISIHALLAESDSSVRPGLAKRLNFYPRSPCGERLYDTSSLMKCQVFLSTLSLRRATRLGLLGWLRTLISIHALLAESDLCEKIKWRCSIHDFYPRSPCGERRLMKERTINWHQFLSTLSLRRATCSAGTMATSRGTFLSTLSLRRATQRQIEFERYSDISIHALLAESDSRTTVLH